MKQITFKEKYPVFTLEIEKEECVFSSTDEIISYFQEKVEAHPVADFIAIFDHFSHTKNLETSGKGGEISPEILDAKNIVFCFGKELPSPLVLAVRPRSIGVAEFSGKFVISFMETPNPASTKTAEEWIKNLVK
jgi:hypothetical protein